MPMKNPPHPGLSVRLNCLEPFGLSVTEGAKALGVSRTTLSRLVNGQACLQTWRSVFPRLSAPRPTSGYACRRPMIWRKPGCMRMK